MDNIITKILFGIFSFLTESSTLFLVSWPPLSCMVSQGPAGQNCFPPGAE